MPEPIASYRTRVSGLWAMRHTIASVDGTQVGVLTIRRDRKG